MPIVVLLLLCSCFAKQDSPIAVQQNIFTSLAVQQDGKHTGAWGYMIFHNDKLLIQQFTIPAVDGNRHFANQQQAAVVGGLVAEKLNHAQHPGISKRELDSLGIIQIHDTIKEK